MATFADHDAYIAAAPEALRPLLDFVRARLAQALPDAQELIQYNMPGFAAQGLVIAGYGAFSKQCGLYVSKGAISAYSDDIAAAGLKASKTGVTFSPTRPMSEDLIAALALASRKELGV
ncbi:iron chaperone [Pelagibacterium halotolerans]|uniref:YdhG-like domain-containing protein n=1 Tax=Pelagibacterium halotolerans (strain DSM 22347 / JCM 15775 / CGMCC 1.7692 / B2) TaxID=1082931 RepID=G4RCA9_PELHB|nr:DUF1801 domain-containing protein [Pelagibacterium halotolerans]AEQ52732.1 conserved hypothetical protein [Pelagibacterium halotolerans B2]QJR17565.1 DUF1801 domain-containing protein [Pelagibacterium halotolerans]SEA85175.1 Uncharacterized conserved protein YdhG, YjbR/CyaY-like superfamily, DUF1801 family [Pelagibacterium halotolerans]